MIVGSVEQLADEGAARQAVAALLVDVNRGACLRTRPSMVFELAEHYRQRELEPDTIWKTSNGIAYHRDTLNRRSS
jgi:hypothetical protein